MRFPTACLLESGIEANAHSDQGRQVGRAVKHDADSTDAPVIALRIAPAGESNADSTNAGVGTLGLTASSKCNANSPNGRICLKG